MFEDICFWYGLQCDDWEFGQCFVVGDDFYGVDLLVFGEWCDQWCVYVDFGFDFVVEVVWYGCLLVVFYVDLYGVVFVFVDVWC